MPDILFKLIKFAIVGTSGLFIDFGTTFLLKEKLKINKFIANAAGFTLAASSNYALNRVWTFHSQNPKIFYEFTFFIIISLLGLAINTAILWFLTQKRWRNFYLSKLVATFVTIIWNFTANFLITFNL
ncbi:MAG: GtrA family protein [Ignavibacteriae bacterium]|nr:MAG: GtrA family protein [Ignavibacteriota bacterium]